MKRKLGVFDSGLGGLTVVKEIRRAFPSVDLIYLGDTARVPYGIRSVETLHRYLEEGCQFLLKHQVDAIVLACNTLSSLLPLSQSSAQDSAPNPAALQNVALFGVIESGARAAFQATRNKKIGLLATDATVHSKAYVRELQLLDPQIEVHSMPAPLLVPLIEEGWLEGEVTEKVVQHYLTPLVDSGIDTLILGCTHYPLLRPLLREELSGTGISIIDNGTALSAELSGLLPELTKATSSLGTLQVCVTDAPRKFDEIARRFLGEELQSVSKVAL
jgi:glutamate racemase